MLVYRLVVAPVADRLYWTYRAKHHGQQMNHFLTLCDPAFEQISRCTQKSEVDRAGE